MEEELVGTVTHYFARPQVGVIRLDAEIRTGDLVVFRGHTTHFQQQIRSMEIEHERVESAAAGTEVAVKVDERVRRGDRVYRIRAEGEAEAGETEAESVAG